MFYNWREFTSRTPGWKFTSWKKGRQIPHQHDGEGGLYSFCVLLSYCPTPNPPSAHQPRSFTSGLKSLCLLLAKAAISSFFKKAFLNTQYVLLKCASACKGPSCCPGKCPNFSWLSVVYSSLCTGLSLNTGTVLDRNSKSHGSDCEMYLHVLM